VNSSYPASFHISLAIACVGVIVLMTVGNFMVSVPFKMTRPRMMFSCVNAAVVNEL
jgi:hypothetical protein